MTVEILQKLAESKFSSLPLFLLTTLGFFNDRKAKEKRSGIYDETPGDNFPYVTMSHRGNDSY